MKHKVKITILSFFTLFLSALNLKHGLIFHTTDNTERDALFSNLEEKTDKKNIIKASIKTINTPKTTTTKKIATAKKTTSSSSKHYDFTNAKYIIKNTGTCPDKDSKNNCVLKTPDTGIAEWHITSGSKPFLYGHNTSTFSKLQNMKPGDTFTVKVGGKTKMYRVVKNLPLSNKNANANREDLYRAKYNGVQYDIALQTCIGSSNANVRYILAVAA